MRRRVDHHDQLEARQRLAQDRGDRGASRAPAEAPRGLVELPPGYRRAAVYSLLAALRLLSRIEDADANLLDRPPHLGLWERLGLLARARWFRAG